MPITRYEEIEAFREFQGGEVIDRRGRVVCRVAIEEMTTKEAMRISNVIVAALKAEFAEE